MPLSGFLMHFQSPAPAAARHHLTIRTLGVSTRVAAPSLPLELVVPPTSSEQEGPATWDCTPQGAALFAHPLARAPQQLQVLNQSFESALVEMHQSLHQGPPRLPQR